MTTDPRQLDPDRLAAEARSLRALARAAAGGGIEGDDLAQEAWLTALERPPAPGFSLRAWLAGIMRNHARDARRAVSRRTAREQLVARPEVVDLEDTVERLDLLQRLLAEARALEEPFRTTILLRYVDGLSTDAIAERLGVPVGTVRARLHRGLARLRSRLDATVQGGRLAWLLPFSIYLPSPAPVVGGVAAASATNALLPATKTWTLVMTMKKASASLLVLAAVGIGAVAIWASQKRVDLPQGSDRTQPTAAARSGGVGLAPIADAGAEAITRVEVPVEGDGTATPTSADHVSADYLLVSGAVRAAHDDTPISGADVTVGLRSPQEDEALAKIFSSKSSFTSSPRLNLVQQQTETDDRGRFAVRLPLTKSREPSLRVYVSARAHGFVYTRIEVATAPGSSELDVQLEMPVGARIAGRVVGPADEPVAGAELWTRKPAHFRVIADRDGGFVLDDVDPRIESYGVRAAADGYSPSVVDVKRQDGRFPTSVEIRLQRAASILGTVFAAGQPTEGATLRILAGKEILETASGADGQYRFGAVPAGTWRLEARHAAWPTFSRTITVPEFGSEAAVARQDVFLDMGRSLRGRVLARDGAPLLDAEVVVVQGSNVLRGTATAADGSYAIVGLPLTTVTVRARSPGYCIGAVDEVPDGQEVVDLWLDRGAGFAATVVDASSGAPLTEFEVRLWQVEDKGGVRVPLREWQAVHDELGRYVTAEPDFGVGQLADLEFRSAGHATSHLRRCSAAVDPDAAALRVAMVVGARLVVRVLDADGGSLARTPVELLLEGGAPVSKLAGFDRAAQSDAAGAVILEHVPPGRHRLRARHAEHGELVHSIEVPDGVAECRETLRFMAGGTLLGMVRTPAGEFVERVPVILLRLDAPSGARSSWRTESGQDGAFSFAQLPAGEFELQRVETREEAHNGKPLPLFSVPVTLRSGERLEVALAPRGAGQIEGRLVAESPLPDTVFLRLEPQEELEPTEPGMRRFPRWLRATDRRFTVPYLLAGRYRLSVYPGAAGNLTGVADVEVRDGVSSDVELRLQPRDG